MADEDVNGIQALLTKLGNLESLVTQKKIVARAVRAGCEPIRARAEELAPIYQGPPLSKSHSPSGTLRESIMTTVTEQSATEAIGKIGPSRKGFYGTFEEFGTSFQSADPFMRPAYDEKIDEALATMADTLSEEIEREARR